MRVAMFQTASRRTMRLLGQTVASTADPGDAGPPDKAPVELAIAMAAPAALSRRPTAAQAAKALARAKRRAWSSPQAACA